MIYRQSLFDLPDLDTLGAAVFDGSYVPSVTDTDIGLLSGEISTGDAPGYARITDIAVTWNAGTYRLEIDTPGDTFDLDGASDVAMLVFYDPSTGALVSWVPFTPHAGFDGWPITVTAAADIADTGTLQVQTTNLDDRVTVLENDPGGGGVPDPSGEDDGDVLTVSSGAAIWAPPSGGGSSWTMEQAGDIGIYTDGTLAIFADYAVAAGPIDTPTLVGTTPAGTRPAVPHTRRISWYGEGMDFGDAAVVIDDDSGTATSTPGGIMVVDLTGTLTNTDDVTPLLLGLTWTVGN